MPNPRPRNTQDSDEPVVIAALAPSPRDPTKITIKLSRGRRPATLHPREVERLNLQPGLEWTAALADRVTSAAGISAVRWNALKVVNRRPISRAALRERLLARGGADADIDQVLADFEPAGLIDDAAYARTLVETELARRPAGERLLKQRLRARAVDTRAARAAIADSPAADPDSARAAAITLARTTLNRLSPDLSPPTRVRRLLGVLMRRGFDEDTAEHAARKVMGREYPE